MQIFVKTPSGKRIVIEVTTDESIEAIKSNIYTQEGFTPQQQHLVFDGVQLTDGRTLADYNIRKESTLELSVHLKIFVITPTQATISLDVDLNDTIESVKSKVRPRALSYQNTCLFFTDTKLDGAKTLAECGVADASTLRLQYSIQIVVKGFDKIFALTLMPGDTVLELRRQIEAYQGYLLRDCYLLCSGRILEEHRTLVDSNVGELSTVIVVGRLRGGGWRRGASTARHLRNGARLDADCPTQHPSLVSQLCY